MSSRSYFIDFKLMQLVLIMLLQERGGLILLIRILMILVGASWIRNVALMHLLCLIHGYFLTHAVWRERLLLLAKILVKHIQNLRFNHLFCWLLFLWHIHRLVLNLVLSLRREVSLLVLLMHLSLGMLLLFNILR